MSIHRRTKRAALIALAGGTAVALSACSTSANSADNSANAADSDTITAVATTTQICDYLTHIAEGGLTLEKTDAQGEKSTTGNGDTTLELTCLLAPNASAHEHEMTPNQMQALAQADYLFTNGVDLEHFLDQAIASSGFHGTMAVTSGVKNSGDAPEGIKVKEGSHRIDVKPWPFAGEDGEEPEFSHDPHVWTSPKQAKIQVENIVEELATKAPSVKEAGASYEKQLEDLDAWAAQSLADIPREDRVLFTSHDAFGYFANAYDVTFIGSALSDFNNQQDATASHIDEAARTVRESGAKAIFAENSNNSKSIEAIARAAGVKAITAEDALYGDSLGIPGSAGETYIGSLIHNVSTLVTAWGGKPAELPESLSEFDSALAQ